MFIMCVSGLGSCHYGLQTQVCTTERCLCHQYG